MPEPLVIDGRGIRCLQVGGQQIDAAVAAAFLAACTPAGMQAALQGAAQPYTIYSELAQTYTTQMLDPSAGWTWNRHGHYDSHIPEVFPKVVFSDLPVSHSTVRRTPSANETEGV